MPSLSDGCLLPGFDEGVGLGVASPWSRDYTAGMSLTLDIVRHAEAAASHAGPDAGRPLTAAGVQALQALATALCREAWRPDRVFASPLLRARESARVLLDAAGLPALVVEILAELEPETAPARVLDALLVADAASGHVVLVAHLPLVERLLLLTAGAGAELPWAPGTLARVSLPQGSARRGQVVVWHVPG